MFDENSLKKIDTKYFNIILMDQGYYNSEQKYRSLLVSALYGIPDETVAHHIS